MSSVLANAHNNRSGRGPELCSVALRCDEQLAPLRIAQLCRVMYCNVEVSLVLRSPDAMAAVMALPSRRPSGWCPSLDPPDT